MTPAKGPASMDAHEIECEVCGECVKVSEDCVSGVVIEYYRFFVERTEYYGFCETHRPDDIEMTKRRIKQGLDPIVGDGEGNGLQDMWPDDPSERVVLTVEPARGPVTTAWVADRAEVSHETACRELSELEDKGWVIRTGIAEWRVNRDALDVDGLFPDNIG